NREPVATDALRLLASLEHRRGEYERSAALCEQLLSDDHADKGQVLSLLLLAENELMLGRFEDAAAHFRAALETPIGDPYRRQARLRLGTALHRLGRFDEAAAELAPFDQGADTPASEREALLMLGDIAFAAGDYGVAVKRFEDFLGGDGVEGDAGTEDALLKLGLARQRLDRHELALEAFDALLARFRDSAHAEQAVFERGQSLLALQDDARARGAFEDSLRLYPDGRFAAAAQRRLAEIAAGRGDLAQSTAYFAAAAESEDEREAASARVRLAEILLSQARHDEVVEAADAALAAELTDGERRRAEIARAIARSRRGDGAEALRDVERLLNDETISGAARASLLYEAAWRRRDAGHNDGTTDAYRELIAIDAAGTLTAHAMVELADLLAADDQHEEAAALLTQSLNREMTDPLRQQALYQLATTRFEQGEFAEAQRQLVTLLADEPPRELLGPASALSGECLFNMGDLSRAAERLRIVIDEYPDDPAHEACMLRLGDCLNGAHRYAEAEEVFVEHLEMYPDSSYAFQSRFGIGWARENQRRYDEAIAAYREVTDHHAGATAARAQFQIGQCLYAQGRHQDAASELLKADILYGVPEWSAAALHEAGRCFEAMGQVAKAREQLSAVIERYPDSAWADMARTRLPSLRSDAVPGRAAAREEAGQ
ncbi:MAG: tetratricopeptide repeat protein, partial [Planctomycetota bacterium]|nr:tetratricopeptide repeat protein [Planctomycetota bacterium]